MDLWNSCIYYGLNSMLCNGNMSLRLKMWFYCISENIPFTYSAATGKNECNENENTANRFVTEQNFINSSNTSLQLGFYFQLQTHFKRTNLFPSNMRQRRGQCMLSCCNDNNYLKCILFFFVHALHRTAFWHTYSKLDVRTHIWWVFMVNLRNADWRKIMTSRFFNADIILSIMF